jgi:hypothetical protein
MAKLTRAAALVLAAASPWFSLEGSALAQAAAPGASAAFPSEAPAPAAPAPAPAPLPTPVSAPPPPPGPPPSAPAYPEPQPYATQSNAYPGGDPPPPPQNPDDGFQRPEISLRIDPLNFLLEGRLGLEIETQLYKFVTLEIVPVFVTTGKPPTLNYASYDSTLRQKSNGLGAISGAAIDAGFWFGGKPFRGYVLRTGFTNYAYTYETSFGTPTTHDSVSHTEREFFAMIGSHNRWGAFTLASGIGLGYELNKQNRCLSDLFAEVPCTNNDHLEIRMNQQGDKLDLHPFLYPFDLLARISLGVVF